MTYRKWKPEYNVSVKQFNDEHKQLFSHLNNLHEGLVMGIGIKDMGYIIDGLVDYTVHHFEHEEKLMLKYNFSEYKQHKQEHEDLLTQVAEFHKDFKSGKKAFSFELLSFLDNWVTHHILDTDMRYKPFFKRIAKEQSERKL